MKTPIQDDFKIEVGEVERVLKLGSNTLTDKHRVPFTIAANGRREVWAGDAIKALRPRFPQRSFLQLKLSKLAGANG